MAQSPPLDVMQTLENQQSIHRYNIESFLVVLTYYNNLENTSFDLSNLIIDANAELDRYIMFGSNERYNKAKLTIEKVIDYYITVEKQAIIDERK